jgi:hypothetical protein
MKRLKEKLFIYYDGLLTDGDVNILFDRKGRANHACNYNSVDRDIFPS